MADQIVGTGSPSGQLGTPGNEPNPNPPNPNPNPPPPSLENGSKERKSGTLYDDLKETPPGQPGAQTWPEDWRKQFGGDDEKAVKFFDRFESPIAAAKGILAFQQRLREGEYTRAAPKSDKPEDIKAWREEVGLPTDQKGYEFEGYDKMPDSDKAIVDNFREGFFKGNVPPAVAKDIMQRANALALKAKEDEAAKDAVNQEAVEDSMRAEWGPEYRPNLQANVQFIDTHLGEELSDLFLTARMSDGRRVSDVPEINKMLNAAARASGADIIVDGAGGGSSVESQIAEIEKVMTTNIRAYEADNAMQDKYGKLLEKRDRLAKRK